MSVPTLAPTISAPAATGQQVERQRHGALYGAKLQDGLLTVQSDRHPEGWLVRVSGDLDLSNIGTLETELQRINGDIAVLIDLSNLYFRDSAGLALLARAADATRSGTGSLAIRNASGQVERLLGLCGLDTGTAVLTRSLRVGLDA